MPAPIGSICVFRDDSLTHWKVAVCHNRDVDQDILGHVFSQSVAFASPNGAHYVSPGQRPAANPTHRARAL